MMKKTVSVLICLAMVFAFAGCGKEETEVNENVWEAKAESFESATILCGNNGDFFETSDRDVVDRLATAVLGRSYEKLQENDSEGFSYLISFFGKDDSKKLELTVMSDDSIIYSGFDCRLCSGDAIDIAYIESLFEETEPPYVYAVNIGGTVYYDTGLPADPIQDHFFIGLIMSECPEGENPTENQQSNFGAGYRYQLTGGNLTVEMSDGTFELFSAGISMKLKEETLTDAGAVFIISNPGNTEYSCGSEFFLDEKADGSWIPIETEEPLSWTAIAYILPPGEETEFAADWEGGYGRLEKGVYRLNKRVRDENGNTSEISAEFEIR